MNNSIYREEILEHWRNPQNWGVVKEADFAVDKYNPFCGDQIHLTGKINKGKIIEIKFSGEGCVISQASASILTEFVKNKELTEVEGFSQEDFLSLLEIQLTVTRLNCALLAFSALQKGLEQWRLGIAV